MDTNVQRRPPVRLDTQDGPWSVSVAESPHDSRSYSLYIKTPNHNLTLTRTAMEILDLDQKLRETNPNVKIPPLPINADNILPPPKRKSNFLNTLSRLASPTSSKTSRRGTNSTILPTPIASPTGEINDPFTSFSPNNVNSPSVVAAPSVTSTGIAAYLTTISNTSSLRQARVWKRFVRVRTDDLESVRVERAIKRVRSDLAAHVGGLPNESDTEQEDEPVATNTDSEYSPVPVKEDLHPVHEKHADYDDAMGDPHTPVEDSLPTPVQSPKELDGDDQNEPQVQVTEGAHTNAIKEQSHSLLLHDEVTSERNAEEPSTVATAVAPEDIPVPTTPTASEAQAQAQAQAQPQRIVRSQSADPDKSSRLARAFAQSAPVSQPPTSASEMDGGASSATGDDSSISTTNHKRKKRSKSTTAPRDAKRHKDKEPKKSQRKVNVGDFEMMRVLGKGCAGKVLLVKHRPTSDLYALKAITKRHVLAHQELQHTLTEQAVLKRMAAEGKDPFVVKLWWSFHDKENLFLVMDFHPGGDLATQLARWGRLGRDRARFYAAEIVEGVEGLHAAGVIYRDLKPENILIGADGHIVLTDFGLSKEFPRRSSTGFAPLSPSGSGEIGASAAWMKNGNTGLSASASEQVVGWPGQGMDQTTTFCGTAEYLAPEVIQGLPYSYEVDWWSFGTMLYEMLTGITPFWANNHSDMYVRVLQDELQFPEDRAIDQDTKSLIRGLLQKNPALRMCEPRVKRHPYFSMIDWSHVYFKRYIPPYIPPIDPSNASDTQNFDDTFLDMEPVLDEYVDEQTTDTDQDMQTDTDRTDGEDTATTPSQSRSSSIRPTQTQAQGTPSPVVVQQQQLQQQQQQQPQQQLQLQLQQQIPQQQEDTVDVFDGYSFKGRHSVLIDSSDEEEDEEDEDEEEGSGSERTGTTGTGIGTGESSEAGDDSSVLGSVVQDIAKPETIEEEDLAEPKTPEARPIVIVEPEPEPEDIEELLANAKELESKLEEGEPAKTPTEEKSHLKELAAHAKEIAKPAVVVPAQPQFQQLPQKVVAVAAPRPTINRNKRRERSGVPALDKDLPEDTEAGEDTGAGAIDEEDDDWDFVEAVDGEDRNGAKGTSLFARGVVDRYRLAVFRKASTPSRAHQQQRNASGMSKVSERTVEDGGSPSPTQRRGRTTLTFTRKGPRQFLQPKSQTKNDTPPSSFSSKKSRKSFGAFQHSSSSIPNSNGSNSGTTSAAASSSTALLTPSLSMGSMMSPSLKSKESAVSVSAQSLSSDQSGGGNGGRVNGVGREREHGVLGGHDTVKVTSPVVPEETPEKMKTAKKLKKYKEGAEKVFSLFSSASSPRGHHGA